MIVSIEKISCRELGEYKNSNREKPFWVVKYIFNFQSEKYDKALLNKITKAGEELAASVNENAANDSTKRRSKKRILVNAIAGILAEYCWKNFLNSVSLDLLVKETSYKQAKNQIDLETIRENKTIEVRSSFPRNGVRFAICSQSYEFDILGPYKNDYKPGEIKKDYYLRTLYHLSNPLSFLEEYKKDDFTVFLTGGATWEMIANDEIAIEKNLIPEDEISGTEIESIYRVVPFSRALDCNAIYYEIKKREISKETD